MLNRHFCCYLTVADEPSTKTELCFELRVEFKVKLLQLPIVLALSLIEPELGSKLGR